jgi:hypothetical protein
LCGGILVRGLSLEELSLCLWGNHHCNNGGNIIGICSTYMIWEVNRSHCTFKFFIVLQERLSLKILQSSMEQKTIVLWDISFTFVLLIFTVSGRECLLSNARLTLILFLWFLRTCRELPDEAVLHPSGPEDTTWILQCVARTLPYVLIFFCLEPMHLGIRLSASLKE